MTKTKLGLAVVLLSLGLFVFMLLPVMKAVALGGILTIVIYPIFEWIQRRFKQSASLAALMTTLGLIFLVLLPFVFIVLMSVQALHLIGDSQAIDSLTGSQITQFTDALLELLHKKLSTLGVALDAKALRSYVFQSLQQILKSAAGLAGVFFSVLPQLFLSVFIMLLTVYFFLKDGKQMVALLFQLSPFTESQTQSLLISLQKSMKGVVLGSVITGSIQTLLCLIGLLVFSVPQALLLSSVGFLMTFIPIVGIAPVSVGSVIYLLSMQKTGAAIGMLVLVVSISLVDNIVRPWIQSSHSKIHPLLALLSVFGGLSVFGASGIFLGPVLAAFALWVIDSYLSYRQISPASDDLS